MAAQRPATADKIIVDRTKAHRSPEMARAIRRTRDKLAEQAGSPSFDRDLLKLHARAMLGTVVAMPLLILVIATVGVVSGVGMDLLLWAPIAMIGYAALALVSRKVDRTDVADIDVAIVSRNFLIAHFLSGLGWIYFAWTECEACGVETYTVVKAVILLVAIGATAIVASALRNALVATFALPVMTFALVNAMPFVPSDFLMIAVLIASLPFFGYIATHFNRSALMLLSFRTEKDALIAELETANAISDEARRRAEEANLAKSRFLASMSHELRTPLNAILGFSEVMAHEVLGPMPSDTYRGYAHDIHQSGTHLLDLINEILDLSRIEAGRYQLNEEPLTLADVVADCCRLMDLRAKAKDIRIVQQLETGMPRLLGDERAIRQVALNLLSNAVKFTPSGGEIRARAGWTASGGQYLSIKDNGPGIAPAEIPIVLSAFGQGAIAIKSAEEGSGLGLPIVQGLMAMHGGTFELRSKLREGTEAIAIFPSMRIMVPMPAMPTAAVATARR